MRETDYQFVLYSNPPDQNITDPCNGTEFPISSDGGYFEINQLIVSVPYNADGTPNYPAMTIQRIPGENESFMCITTTVSPAVVTTLTSTQLACNDSPAQPKRFACISTAGGSTTRVQQHSSLSGIKAQAMSHLQTRPSLEFRQIKAIPALSL
jgi:hypothetical protein